MPEGLWSAAPKTGDASLFLSRVSMSRYAEMPEIGRRPRFYALHWALAARLEEARLVRLGGYA
jgi:hypothetical protein